MADEEYLLVGTTLWLTDRSRYDAGLDHCRRARFLNYHWGPSGYGIAKRAQSIPLSTGISYHDGLAHVLEHVLAHDTLPPDPVVREACARATGAYRKVVEARGLQQLAEGERVDTIIAEQETLIEGLVWAFALTTLPWIHEQGRILHVEQEELLVLGCTCGLGDRIGMLEDHQGRDCQGIGLQSRPDFLTEYRARPGVYASWEFKGAAYAGFGDDWETKIQFALGALSAQERLGVPISEAWVVQLLKGRREGSEYDPQTKQKSGPLMQNTSLCYWYRREGNPPMEAPDWQEQYEWVDEQGKNRRLGNNYRKAGLWTLPQDAPEIKASGVSIAEFAAKLIPKERLGRHVALVGPLQINQVIAGELLEELVAEERRWQETVWQLYDTLTNDAGGDWTHPSYQQALNTLVPRNFSGCRRFGRRYECQFKPLCFYEEGWKDPLGSGAYVHRRPHHTPEVEQQVARGLVVPEGLAEEGE